MNNWSDNLVSGVGTYDYVSKHEDEISKVKKKFFDDMAEKGPPLTAFSAFGPETKGTDAYVEEILYPPEGGTFFKLYGCSYLYKGLAPRHVVNGLQLAKELFSETPRNIFKHPLLAIGPVLFYLFQRKAFLREAEVFLRAINHKVTEHYEPSVPERYNEFEKEIERALLIAVEGEGWERVFIELIRFVKLFFYVDNTYRFRVQDALGAGGKTIDDALNTLIARETPIGIVKKWKFMKIGYKFLCLTSPAVKRISRKFMENLNIDKVKMDEADVYFSLEWRSYNFMGWDEEGRMAERKRLDKLHHHVFLVADREVSEKEQFNAIMNRNG